MKKNFTKLWKIMKICATQTMIAMVICGISVAHDNYGQLLDKKVTLDLRGVTLEMALHSLQDASQVKIFFSREQFPDSELTAVTLEVEDKPLRQLLEELLSPYNINYRVDEKNQAIVVLKRSKYLSVLNPEEGKTDMITPQTRPSVYVATITGKVTDATTQQPMAGVNILIKGTTNGTTTDANGTYTINVDDKDILVFSFIGYTSFETQVNGQSTIDVVLSEDMKKLNEVIVNAGYYETTKEMQTGSIVKIEASDIQKQPVSNSIAALQGRVSGLDIIQQNGVPGGNFKVRIRGTNSLANGNDPLYIIDVVPYISSPMSLSETSGNILGSSASNATQGNSPLNSINTTDIESIEVLKDADATAIYGSRGANGVILITTKKGTAGKTKVDFNFYGGRARVANQMNLLSTQQYIQMRKEAFRNDNITPTIANAPDLLLWDTTRYTNWQKELIGGSASIADAQLSISGGEGNTQFIVSSAFHRETTVFPGTNSDQRVTIHASITNRSSHDRLKTLFSVNYGVNTSSLPGLDLSFRSLTISPNAPALYSENGNLNWVNWNTVDNPVAFLKRKYEATNNNLVSSTALSYSIVRSLEVKLNLGYTNITNNATTITPISSINPAATNQINSTIFSNSRFQNWIAEPQISWSPKFKFGKIGLLVGTTFLEQETERLAQYASGFSAEALMKNIGAASTVSTSTNYYSQYRYHALFGRLNYVIKERYIFNITGRRDGSSRFGPGKQFSVFGAVGAAWLFTKEGFMHDRLPFLSFGKLRASYGTTGNDQIGDYQYLDSYALSGNYHGSVGLSPARLYNPTFAWESNRKFEGGIELGFVEDHIRISTSYYNNRSSSQLVSIPLAPTTGFTNIQGNLPAVIQNSGLEIEINTSNLERSYFSWSTSFNTTVPKSSLVEFPNLSLSPVYDIQYVVGQPLEIQKLYQHQGIDATTGVYQFADINEDGTFDVNDRKQVKFFGRKFFGGVQNSFRFHGVKLDILFQFVKQQGFNYTHLFGHAPGTLGNQPDLVMNRWTSEGSAKIQRFTSGGTATTTYSNLLYNSDGAVTDASFIRLKNLSLSYELPSRWNEKVKAIKINVFIQAQNLLTISKYEGLDPETVGSGVLPPLRTITLGIHTTF